MAADGTTVPSNQISISPSAARRIAELIAAEGGDDQLRLRISVSGGGCSGFQYGFTLDDQQHDEDRVFERDGVSVLVDEVSLDLLGGAQLDYVEDLIGSYFAVKNPNASSTCGCGSSFSV